jgi:hypothetical protein
MTNTISSDPVDGLCFTTLRDDSIDHLGIRTRRGIVDVAQAAEALRISTPPPTVDDLLAPPRHRPIPELRAASSWVMQRINKFGSSPATASRHAFRNSASSVLPRLARHSPRSEAIAIGMARIAAALSPKSWRHAATKPSMSVTSIGRSAPRMVFSTRRQHPYSCPATNVRRQTALGHSKSCRVESQFCCGPRPAGLPRSMTSRR